MSTALTFGHEFGHGFSQLTFAHALSAALKSLSFSIQSPYPPPPIDRHSPPDPPSGPSDTQAAADGPGGLSRCSCLALHIRLGTPPPPIHPT